jgi:GNAT superfamily N-acetyltransferase
MRPGLFVHTLYVALPHRRQKVATKLIESLQKIAEKKECNRIDLMVFKRNGHALDLLKQEFGAHEVDNINHMRIPMM